MTVAVFCVGVDWAFVMRVPSQWIVLLRDVLGEVWRDHLLNLLRRGLAHERVCVLYIAGLLQMSCATHRSLMVVSLEKSGVRVRGSTTRHLRLWKLGAPGQASALGALGRLQMCSIGCDSFDDMRGI